MGSHITGSLKRLHLSWVWKGRWEPGFSWLKGYVSCVWAVELGRAEAGKTVQGQITKALKCSAKSLEFCSVCQASSGSLYTALQLCARCFQVVLSLREHVDGLFFFINKFILSADIYQAHAISQVLFQSQMIAVSKRQKLLPSGGLLQLVVIDSR